MCNSGDGKNGKKSDSKSNRKKSNREERRDCRNGRSTTLDSDSIGARTARRRRSQNNKTKSNGISRGSKELSRFEVASLERLRAAGFSSLAEYREHRRNTRAAWRGKGNYLKDTPDLPPLVEVEPEYENLKADKDEDEEDEEEELTRPDEHPSKNLDEDSSDEEQPPPACAVSTHPVQQLVGSF